MRTLFILIWIFYFQSFVLFVFDVLQRSNYYTMVENNEPKPSCYFKNDTWFMIFWFITRSLQSLLPSIITLVLFWSKKSKKDFNSSTYQIMREADEKTNTLSEVSNSINDDSSPLDNNHYPYLQQDSSFFRKQDTGYNVEPHDNILNTMSRDAARSAYFPISKADKLITNDSLYQESRYEDSQYRPGTRGPKFVI